MLDNKTKNQNNATGLTIDPVPPLIINGVAINRKSFLLSDSQVSFTNAALQRLTGINQRQLQHYASGISRPRPEQKKRIEAALHRLGEELLAVEL